MTRNRAIRHVSSWMGGAVTFVLMFFGVGSDPVLLGCDTLVGSLVGLSVWYSWPVFSRGGDAPPVPDRDEPTVENIEARLPELIPLGLKISDDELRDKVGDIHTLACKVLKYLKANPDTSPPEASILLMKNVQSTISTVTQYLLLPKHYDETTANFARAIDSAYTALESLFDSLCRHDADGFARACEVVEQTLKALDALLPIGRTQ